MTADRNFLFWLHDRLVMQYGESENVDFVQKLKAIARNTPPVRDTMVCWQGNKRYNVIPGDGDWCIVDEAAGIGVAIAYYSNKGEAQCTASLLNLRDSELKELQAKLAAKEAINVL